MAAAVADIQYITPNGSSTTSRFPNFIVSGVAGSSVKFNLANQKYAFYGSYNLNSTQTVDATTITGSTFQFLSTANITINPGAGNYNNVSFIPSVTATITLSNTFNVNGTAVFDNSGGAGRTTTINGGTISISGNADFSPSTASNIVNGSTNITFTGGTAATLTVKSTTVANCSFANMTVNKSGSTLTFQSALVSPTIITITGGQVSGALNTAVSLGKLVISAGQSYTRNGGASVTLTAGSGGCNGVISAPSTACGGNIY
jgi:hypothetical protein